MKRILLLLAICVYGCSSDDVEMQQPDQLGKIEVLNYDAYDSDTSQPNSLYNFTANVKNGTSQNVSGKVKFKIKSGNAFVFAYVDGYNIASGGSQIKSQLSNIYFASDPEIIEVSFEKE